MSFGNPKLESSFFYHLDRPGLFSAGLQPGGFRADLVPDRGHRLGAHSGFEQSIGPAAPNDPGALCGLADRPHAPQAGDGARGRGRRPGDRGAHRPVCPGRGLGSHGHGCAAAALSGRDVSSARHEIRHRPVGSPRTSAPGGRHEPGAVRSHDHRGPGGRRHVDRAV